MDYWPEIKALAKADIGAPREFVLRYVIIISSGFAIFLALEQVSILVWLFLYLSTNLSYSYFLTRAQAPVHFPRYVLLISMNFITSGLYAVLPVYLITLQRPEMTAIALCGLIGMAMFNLARHNKRGAIAYWDTFLVIASCLFIGVFQVLVLEQTSEKLVVLVGCAAISAYYATSQFSAISMQEKMRDRRARAEQAQKMEAIGRLTGGVAHDFNNILTVVKGNLELFDALDDPVEQRKVLEEARAAANRATSVIGQLLAFSRQSQLRPRPMHPAAFFEEAEPFLRRALPSSIVLEFQPAADLHAIFVDQNQLMSAILNLALNARDAMPDGGKLTLAATVVKQPQFVLGDTLQDPPYLAITVTDTGQGISANVLERVSEPFFTTKPVGKGSGLGVSMVRGFLEQSGGGLSIYSTPGRGTRVTMIFPYPKGHEEHRDDG